jgi:hypothetical protein
MCEPACKVRSARGAETTQPPQSPRRSCNTPINRDSAPPAGLELQAYGKPSQRLPFQTYDIRRSTSRCRKCFGLSSNRIDKSSHCRVASSWCRKPRWQKRTLQLFSSDAAAERPPLGIGLPSSDRSKLDKRHWLAGQNAAVNNPRVPQNFRGL